MAAFVPDIVGLRIDIDDPVVDFVSLKPALERASRRS
jgi:hypothetical protein